MGYKCRTLTFDRAVMSRQCKQEDSDGLVLAALVG